MKQSLHDKLISRDSKIHEILRDSFLNFIWESFDWNLKIKVISSMANRSRTSPKEILDIEISNYDLQKR